MLFDLYLLGFYAAGNEQCMETGKFNFDVQILVDGSVGVGELNFRKVMKVRARMLKFYHTLILQGPVNSKGASIALESFGNWVSIFFKLSLKYIGLIDTRNCMNHIQNNVVKAYSGLVLTGGPQHDIGYNCDFVIDVIYFLKKIFLLQWEQALIDKEILLIAMLISYPFFYFVLMIYISFEILFLKDDSDSKYNLKFSMNSETVYSRWKYN